MRELVERRFGKRLAPSAVRLCLRRWGMTPRKPLARAEERSPAAIAAWLERDCPAIARWAKAAKAVTDRGDATGLSNRDPIGRSYAPKGRTPVVRRTAKRATRSMIAAVSNRGLRRFLLHDGVLDAERFLAFLRRPIKDAGRRVVLIVGNLKVRKAGEVQAWAASHGHAIKPCHLLATPPSTIRTSTSTMS